jgi:hypothetical protein
MQAPLLACTMRSPNVATATQSLPPLRENRMNAGRSRCISAIRRMNLHCAR